MDEPQDPPQTQTNVSNKELKTIVIDLGADLVDTLDSIHNAILATRNQISALKKRMDDYDHCATKETILKEGNDTPSKNADIDDNYSAYIA
tara:strand:- start:18886 stop:19158 length:273 start_codon:yes stop_codon:yes gene_type:complete